MLPEDLRQLADQLDQQGLEAARTGDTHGAADKFFQANNLRESAAALEGKLRHAPTSGNIRPVVTEGRLQRSASAKGGGDPLAKAARAAGMTVRQLVQALRKELEGTDGFRGASHVTLMRARRGEATVWRPTAECIARLTGFAVNARNWPGGIRD